MTSWRLIIDGQRDAAYNMSADAVLWQQAEKTDGPPVLRLYQWLRPSITIGYHQKPETALRLEKLGETPLARRITGGRALLHDDGEITYAVAGNFTNYPQLGNDLWKSYLVISQAIIEFYRSLGWVAEMSLRQVRELSVTGPSVQKGCFAAISRHELLVEGEKMAASSQRRSRQALVQHGAVRFAPMMPHPAIEIPDFGLSGTRYESATFDYGQMQRDFVGAVESVFDVRLILEPFSETERQAIESRRDQYKISMGH